MNRTQVSAVPNEPSFSTRPCLASTESTVAEFIILCVKVKEALAKFIMHHHLMSKKYIKNLKGKDLKNFTMKN